MQERLAKVKQRKTIQELPGLDFDPLADDGTQYYCVSNNRIH